MEGFTIFIIHFRKMLFLSHFIKVWLTYQKLYIFNVCHKHFHHLQKFSPALCIYSFWGFLFVIRTQHKYKSLSNTVLQYNTVLLTIDTMLYRRSLGLLHIAELKLSTLWVMTPCFLLPPDLVNHHPIFCFYEFNYFRFLI